MSYPVILSIIHPMKSLRVISILVIGSALVALVASPLPAADSGKTKIINFGANWCPGCKLMKPHFNDVSREYRSEVDFQYVNADFSALDDSYGVTLLPTVVAVKNGKVVGRKVGYMDKAQLTAFVKQHR